jgi:mersacidin/lichenicidin family type 2 lantibiotic
MSKLDIVRAWKDEEYCGSLNDEQRALLPENPAGVIELTDGDLAAAGGTQGEITPLTITLPICPTFYMCTLTVCITITFAEADLQ